LRERRGLSRKALAGASRVSERYLAQIEAGNGNVSVILLRRVAAALDTTVAALLAADAGAAASRRERIALIGLRGAGKSTLGAMLAHTRHVPLIELNREVTRETGLPVAEVMALYGLPGYRRIEQRVLERVVAGHGRAVIVAGGGIVHEPPAFAFLLEHCYTVWLKARPDEHMSRVRAQGDLRPMAGNAEAMEDLKRILAAREALYRRADAVVDTSGETPQASFAKLRDVVEGASRPPARASGPKVNATAAR
ncbi:MAG: helix-turn-helix transcriptional regulator, partial [Rudaea sp.]